MQDSNIRDKSVDRRKLEQTTAYIEGLNKDEQTNLRQLDRLDRQRFELLDEITLDSLARIQLQQQEKELRHRLAPGLGVNTENPSSEMTPNQFENLPVEQILPQTARPFEGAVYQPLQRPLGWGPPLNRHIEMMWDPRITPHPPVRWGPPLPPWNFLQPGLIPWYPSHGRRPTVQQPPPPPRRQGLQPADSAISPFSNPSTPSSTGTGVFLKTTSSEPKDEKFEKVAGALSKALPSNQSSSRPGHFPSREAPGELEVAPEFHQLDDVKHLSPGVNPPLNIPDEIGPISEPVNPPPNQVHPLLNESVEGMGPRGTFSVGWNFFTMVRHRSTYHLGLHAQLSVNKDRSLSPSLFLQIKTDQAVQAYSPLLPNGTGTSLQFDLGCYGFGLRAERARLAPSLAPDTSFVYYKTALQFPDVINDKVGEMFTRFFPSLKRMASTITSLKIEPYILYVTGQQPSVGLSVLPDARIQLKMHNSKLVPGMKVLANFV